MKKLLLAIATLLIALGARTDNFWDYLNGTSYISPNPVSTGVDILIKGSNHYLNWGSVTGTNGYGIRDNGGVMEFKNSGGSWAGVGGGSGSASSTLLSDSNTWTGNNVIYGDYPTFKIKNYDSAQYSGAGFSLINTAVAGGGAGYTFYGGINDVADTQGFLAVDAVNSSNGGTGHVLLFTGTSTAEIYPALLVNGNNAQLSQDASGYLNFQEVAAGGNGQQSIMQILAPTDPQESTITLSRQSSAGNREFSDWTDENYGAVGSLTDGLDHLTTINIAKQGTGVLRPFGIRWWNQDLGTIAATGKFQFLMDPSGATAIGDYATTTGAATNKYDKTIPLQVSSSTASLLFQVNAGVGTQEFAVGSASSTIGNGTQAGGLTISGGATTTGMLRIGNPFASEGGNLRVNGAIFTNSTFSIPGLTELSAGKLYSNTGLQLNVSDGTDRLTWITIPQLAAGGYGIPFGGIGTSTPRWPLTIAASTSPQLTLSDQSLTNAPWNFRAIGSMLYISTSSPTTFATTTIPVFSLNSSSGNVGINTQSPATKLEVNGTASSSGLIVSTLSGILKANGTSAATVAANGTDFSLITANTCGSGHFSSVTAAGVFTCTADAAAAFSYPFPSSATSSLLTFGGGTLISTSTIGNLFATSTLLWNMATGTAATTTWMYSGIASTTQFYGANLTTCTGSNHLQYSAATGKFSCTADAAAAFSYLFTNTTWAGANAGATTTTLMFPLVSGSSSIGYLTAGSFFATSTATSTINGNLVGQDILSGLSGNISPVRILTLQTGTTTTYTAGTTTGAYIPYTIAPFNGTIKTAYCKSDSFMAVDPEINATPVVPNYWAASSTIGTITFTGSNTFTKGQPISMKVGSTTNTNMTYVTCTFTVVQTS